MIAAEIVPGRPHERTDRVHALCLLTPDGAVIALRLDAAGGTFLEAEGRALTVEDDADLAADLAETFRDAGFAVDATGCGEEAAHLGEAVAHDIAILDIGLPGRDGIAGRRAWREAGRTLPVLALTARDAWADKAPAFRAGVDDHVTKPFFLPEVILRARTLIRRAAGHATPENVAGALRHDPGFGTFTLDWAPSRRTAFEARVPGDMMHHAGRILSRTEIGEHVHDDGGDRDFGALEVHHNGAWHDLGDPAQTSSARHPLSVDLIAEQVARPSLPDQRPTEPRHSGG